MAYVINTNYQIPLGHPNRSGNFLYGVKAVIIHYTANYNASANAVGNANYFKRGYDVVNGIKYEKGTTKKFVTASAHYIVDQSNVILSIPDHEVAWHVGASSTAYTTIANTEFKNTSGFTEPNRYTIGIELCVNAGNDWYATCDLSAELVADLLIKYNLSIDNVYRHFDITSKNCPAPFVSDIDAWQNYKNLILQKYIQKKGLDKMIITPFFATMKCNIASLNVRDYPSVGNIKGQLVTNQVIEVIGKTDTNWYKFMFNEQEAYVYGNYLTLVKDHKFSDIAGHKYEDAILYCVEKGLIKVDGTYQFNPDNTYTKGEICDILDKFLKLSGI